MTIQEAITARHSVRTFTPEMPDGTVLDYVKEYAAGTESVFAGTSCRLVLLEKAIDGKIGTYGIVRGAQCCVAVIHGRGAMDAVNAGMLGERLVLGLTTRGMGTVWIGGTFSGSDIARATSPSPDETIAAIIPFGIPASRESMVSRIMSAMAGSKSRKPFDELFSVAPDSPFRKGLELMRLAPSAVNKQGWRAVEARGNLHFFSADNSKFGMIDMGIGLEHFAVGAPAGVWKHMDCAALRPQWQYVVSWDVQR